MRPTASAKPAAITAGTATAIASVTRGQFEISISKVGAKLSAADNPAYDVAGDDGEGCVKCIDQIVWFVT